MITERRCYEVCCSWGLLKMLLKILSEDLKAKCVFSSGSVSLCRMMNLEVKPSVLLA